MPKFTAPLPHDLEAEAAEFRKAFASAMVKGNQISPPASKPALELGGSGAGLVGNLVSGSPIGVLDSRNRLHRGYVLAIGAKTVVIENESGATSEVPYSRLRVLS